MRIFFLIRRFLLFYRQKWLTMMESLSTPTFPENGDHLFLEHRKLCDLSWVRFSPGFPPLCLWGLSSSSNEILTASDHGAVQINVGKISSTGLYTGQWKTVAFSGQLRKRGLSDQVRFYLTSHLPFRCELQMCVLGCIPVVAGLDFVVFFRRKLTVTPFTKIYKRNM